MPLILDGTATQKVIKEELAVKIAMLREKGVCPGLGIVQVGDRKDSDTYIRMKGKACNDLGIHFVHKRHEESIAMDDLVESIECLNNDKDIHGIIVQLPLPSHLDESVVLSAVSKEKDVDGFHPENMGNVSLNRLDNCMAPCTPSGCIELLDRSNIDLNGKNVVVLGRSNIVGLPMALLALHRNATVSICHSKTENIREITRNADVLVCACGRREMVTADWIKEGCVIVDVGINAVDDPSKKRGYRLVGDVDYNSVVDKVSAITPVPGGVGPMTIAMLLSHTVDSCIRITN
jgi:5,10-methylene-tetrahydrofolate dehydrogenase/methenyl tetrahydrofolate cyclohydrolase